MWRSVLASTSLQGHGALEMHMGSYLQLAETFWTKANRCLHEGAEECTCLHLLETLGSGLGFLDIVHAAMEMNSCRMTLEKTFLL